MNNDFYGYLMLYTFFFGLPVLGMVWAITMDDKKLQKVITVPPNSPAGKALAYDRWNWVVKIVVATLIIALAGWLIPDPGGVGNILDSIERVFYFGLIMSLGLAVWIIKMVVPELFDMIQLGFLLLVAWRLTKYFDWTTPELLAAALLCYGIGSSLKHARESCQRAFNGKKTSLEKPDK